MPRSDAANARFWRPPAGVSTACRLRKAIRRSADLWGHDSADTWCRPNLFKLTEDGRPAAVSGVPPDYFSTTGQLWGHPVFRWSTHRRTRYDWWVRRFTHHLDLFDLLRIDHFRGLVAYWEVPAGRRTAAAGRWVAAPAEDFLPSLRSACRVWR
jgi:4-alpha-glucanotransferase